MTAHGTGRPTRRSGWWPAGRSRGGARSVYDRGAVIDAIRVVLEAAVAFARSTPLARFGHGRSRKLSVPQWRDSLTVRAPLWWPSRRRPWEAHDSGRWTDGAGRAGQMVLLALAVTAVIGGSVVYVLHQTSPASQATQTEPLPWPEIDLSVPTLPPYASPSASPSGAPRPSPSKAATPRPTATNPRPRPKPPTAKPRKPVRIISEAEAPQHQTSGITRARGNKAASGYTVIGWVGNGNENKLRLSVTVPDTDQYLVTLFYFSADTREAVIRVNGGSTRTVDFPPTEDWSTVRSLVLQLPLRGGPNTIEIGNPYYYGPDIDRFMVIR